MTRRGFTILEIMVVIFLIGLIATIAVPRFLRSPIPEAEQFMGKLNGLVIQAVEQAQQADEPRRVFFDLSARIVEIQTVKGTTSGGRLVLPESVQLTDVVINNTSQFGVGGTKHTVYFFINAEGISQEVRLMLTEQTPSGERLYQFLLNPFTSTFRLA